MKYDDDNRLCWIQVWALGPQFRDTDWEPREVICLPNLILWVGGGGRLNPWPKIIVGIPGFYISKFGTDDTRQLLMSSAI